MVDLLNSKHGKLSRKNFLYKKGCQKGTVIKITVKYSSIWDRRFWRPKLLFSKDRTTKMQFQVYNKEKASTEMKNYLKIMP